ncbi:MAG: hypothetical protein ABR946_11345 [Solirubrobacteraceae bacterium]
MLAIGLLGPATASAHKHIVAPGDPGSAQYQEDVPTAAGGQPVTTVQPVTSQAASVLPQSTVHQLSKDGAAGRHAAAVATETAPAPFLHKLGRALRYRNEATTGVVAGAIFGAGGGMGTLLPVLLGVSLIAAIALAIRRKGS